MLTCARGTPVPRVNTGAPHEGADVSTGTLNGMFVESARTNGSAAAFRHRTGDDWVTVTYSDALARVEAIGAGLVDLGVAPGDRVSILSNSRLEWTLCDYATLGTGAT